MKNIFCSALTLIIGMLAHMSAFAQQLPLQSQFFLNPYAYNPAFVGANGYNEIFLTHRRQWMGIEGAPVTTRISVHLPSRGKLSYGMNLYNDKRGLLATTSALFTVGYKAQLGEDQYLKAGLSGGLGMNAIDLTQVENASDPAVANAANNNMFFDGNAGISYQYKNLNLGVALPKLFSKNMVYADGFNKLQVKRLDHFLFSASYKFNLANGAVVVEPQLVYQTAEGLPSQFESAAIVYLRDVIWFGGAYRQNNGPAAFAGVKLTNSLRMGYAYETTPARVMGFSNGTHELTLNMRFGAKKEQKRKANIPAYTSRKTVEQEKKAFTENNIDPQKLKNVDAEKINKEISKLPANELEQNNPASRVQAKTTNAAPKITNNEANPIAKFNGEVAGKAEEKIAEQKKENKLELAKGHYVVISAFRIFDNALKYHEVLSDKYINCKYGFSSKSLYYYTYLTYTKDIAKARVERDKMRKIKGFENTWVLTIE